MLSELEKVFDSAFFNADHNLKIMEQVLQSIDDMVLSEDLGSHLSGAIGAINTQIASMAFCFAQLMCRTIVLSENYFMLKERFSQVKVENFHLKSDKGFVEFSRKLNKILVDSPGAKLNVQPNSSTNNGDVQTNSNTATKSHKKRRKKKRSHTKEVKVIGRKPSLQEDDSDDFEQFFLYSQPTSCMYQNATFRVHRYNNNAFRLLYRNFKEVELIDDLRSQNLALQKEIVMLQTDLSSHQLMVRYLNNQLSGRIQQIQLLTREKRDSNFERVWSDLESEIQLNKFKTIVRAFHTGPKESGLISLIQNFYHSNVEPTPNASAIDYASPSVSSDEVLLNPSPENVENTQPAAMLQTNQCSTSSQQVFYTEEPLKIPKLNNFKQSWLNIGLLRFVFVNLTEKDLGISIIGGKEYGLPIMISEIHTGSGTHLSGGLRPGDIILTVDFIDVTDFTHDEAANLLKSLAGKCRFGVIYFKPEDDSSPVDHSRVMASPGTSSSLISLSDLPRLSADYYRTVFRATLLSPFGFASDTSSDEESNPRGESRAESHHSTESPVASDRSDHEPLINLFGAKATLDGSTTRRAIPGIASRLFSSTNTNTHT